MSTPLDRALLAASWRSWYANDLRIVGPGWLQFVWTLLFSCAIGLGFFVLGLGFSLMGSGRFPSLPALGRFLGINLAIAVTIGYTIHLLFALSQRAIGVDRIRTFSSRDRALYFGGMPLAGVLIGWPLGAWLTGTRSWFPFDRPSAAVASVLISVLLCFVFYIHFDAKARQIDAEKRATEARLRLLQGQMEPHFLFNTLGTVLALIDSDAPQAKRMLETFVDYLRCSLGKLRTEDSTLGDELRMAQAYLALMQMRMGDRLAFKLDIADAALERAALPPLLLQPLVENAVHHGLECKVNGGTVTVSARREGKQLVIDVADDGLGVCEQPLRRAGFAGNGVALDNLRARLQSRWGSEAALTLDLKRDAGARATLRLPLETTDRCPPP
ncbi:MAG TPA: histidine kinase [Burkholderiaceae bacterium]|nr:histidine kinase [Burkholderiaceae bacterium]